MKSPTNTPISVIGILLLCLMVAFDTLAQDSRALSFDADWRFVNGNLTGVENPNYNDTRWRKLDVPHDWSIEDLPVQIKDSVAGPFSKGAISGRDGGFLVGGTSWYRKRFTLDKESDGKETYITFDGVYMNADVWINGHYLGNHPNGYTSFSYNLTPFLLPQGKANVIAVRVKNEGVNSRWYSGSGIYRHVWLTTVNPLHVDLSGIYITTPSVTDQVATVSVETTVRSKAGKAPFTVRTQVYDPKGKLVGTDEKLVSEVSDSLMLLTQRIQISNPMRWTVDEPVLYKTSVKILQDGKRIDETTTMFGIRTIQFDAQTGFSLNGKTLKLRGGCIHHDNGPLGAAAIDRAEERKIELLKQQGYNAVRMSHNPPSSKLLDVCDRLGMLVIDEAFDMWERAKTPEDYHLYFRQWWQKDLESMVLRDRNHPSIIMWSIGNEIAESADSSGYAIGKLLSGEVRRLDSTRPVTMAIPLFITFFNKGKVWEDTAPSFANLDVAGYNYADSKYESDHEKFPNRVMYASEYFPTKGMENWHKVETLPYVIGTFSWTAMDYLGEAGLGAPRLVKQDPKKAAGGGLFGASDTFLNPSWPIFNAYTGELDLIGNKKVNSYYLDVVWKRSPVEMLVHTPIPDGYQEANFYYNFPDQLKSWSFPGQEGKKMKVFVYARAERVTLELNGQVIGEKTLQPSTVTATFEVPFQPGTLIARSYSNGKETGADTLRTVGKPVAIRLVADRRTIRANPNDLSFVNVEVVDAGGMVVPYLDDLLINFQVSGNGQIAGVGNGNPADASSFQRPQKKVFHGRGLVIVRPKGSAGTITLIAKVDGLKDAKLVIVTK